jgi:hypothetical protein
MKETIEEFKQAPHRS